MNLVPIVELLQQRTGLDPGSLGPNTVGSAVASRMHSLRMDEVSNYLDRLVRDSAEFSQLVDEVVVPETWFLRGGELFFYLAEHIRTKLRGVRSHTVFQVLSVPCSTGEEPYSLAIALAERGVPPERYRIDAIDISSRNIQSAQRGLFTELSFRQMDDNLRRRYFTHVPPAWEINPALRSSIRFSLGNLLDPGLLVLERPYDLIFCRNLFIYMHPSARQQGLATLLRLLAPRGLLCLGHAESLDQADRRFERTGPSGYFLYRRANPSAPAVRTAVRAPSACPVAPLSEVPALPKPTPTGHGKDAGLKALLARARQHADTGQLAEALLLCGSAQDRYGPSADVYSLQGIIQQARHERAEAIHSFRKALYLDPDHPEALMHLMLLYQVQGERNQADLLRRRLQRLDTLAGGSK